MVVCCTNLLPVAANYFQLSGFVKIWSSTKENRENNNQRISNNKITNPRKRWETNNFTQTGKNALGLNSVETRAVNKFAWATRYYQLFSSQSLAWDGLGW